MAQATAQYDASSLVHLEGLEPVRKRPGMYIGGVGPAGLHHLIWEILDNSIDEAMNGHATEVRVTLHEDGSTVTVEDNGRGIPVDRHPKTGKPGVEMAFCELHAGGKFEGKNYATSGGLHGVGASVVNALSTKLTVVVKRDNFAWRMDFERGKPVTKLLKSKDPVRGTGTTVTFHPDPQIFPKIIFDAATIRSRIEVASFIHKGIKLSFDDQQSKTKEQFHHPDGIAEFLDKLTKDKGTRPVTEGIAKFEKVEGVEKFECVFRWTESTEEVMRSFVNGIPTPEGGTHEIGMRAAMLKALRNYIETHNLTPRGIKIEPQDAREGVFGLISCFIREPQFQGQTKEKLNNPEVQPFVENALRPLFEQWLNANGTSANAIIARIIAAARARQASREASDAVSRKTATSGRLTLPGKLSDCINAGKAGTELFIVEGDSAGGTGKMGRDRIHQAILPLRGKVPNTEESGLKKVLENKEYCDLVTALGCGIGSNFDPAKLRYERIVLLADADSDGHHITTLLLTFFYRHLKELITAGKIYIAMPPLYRIVIGKDTFWAADDDDKKAILAKHPGKKDETTRFKGLGEMDPKVLWETTLNPKTRRMLRVEIDDAIACDRVINELMGKDPSARFRFIMDRAEEAEEVDLM